MTQPAVDAVRQFVSPGDFVIDIGAHSGDTTVPMALAAGRGGCTLALEPNPYVLQSARRQRGSQSRQNEHRSSLLRGDTSTTAILSSTTAMPPSATAASARSSGGASTGESTPSRSTAAICSQMLQTEFANWLPKLSYIKVDAEGYDRAILASILPIMRERRPVICTEVFRKLVAGRTLCPV